MVILPPHREAMIDHARTEFPNEACGLLASEGDAVIHVYPVRNADQSPVHFTMHPSDQLAAMKDIDDRGWELAAIYHSHTRTRAFPSPTDVEMAQVSLAFYPDARFVIVSLADSDAPEVRAYQINGQEITEVPLDTGSKHLTP